MAAVEFGGIVSLIGVILKVAVGLGAVIFVHELGHFLVALACGVKVEKFMIGFDIGGYKISWRRGETVYGIGILPLGGYVKMLGQDDDPAHIKEQMAKSQIDSHNANAKPIKGPDGETYYVDRRSYLAKSVPQRMAIISAGVIMNVIFAVVFAVIAYGIGVPYEPAVVSEVVPGSAAFRADIRPGDEIVKIGKQTDPTFTQLRTGVTLGDLEKGIECEVRRASDGKVVDVVLQPEHSTGRLATIGLVAPFSLTLIDNPLELNDTPVAHAKLIKPAAGQVPADDAKLMDGDVVIRVGDVPVKDYVEFSTLLAQQIEKAVAITVRRPPKEDDKAGAAKKGDGKAASEKDAGSQELIFEVPAQQLHRYSFSMKMGPITSVRVDSPAAKAGIAAGDLITQVDGKRLGEGASPAETWDGETLSDYLRRAAIAGREVELILLRPPVNNVPREVKVSVKPQVSKLMNMILPRSPGTPMAANEIGIAYNLQNKIAFVRPDSPAAAAEIAAGDKVLQAKFDFPKDKDGNVPEPIVVKLVRDEPSWFGKLWQKVFGGAPVELERFDWPRVVDFLQFIPSGTNVVLTIQRGDAEPRTLALALGVSEGNFIASRGFWFKTIERIRKADTFGQQVRYGWDETTEALSMVFRFLQKIGGQVPVSALGGPVTIAKAAGYKAAEGMSSLLIFLTMLSANLAILNLWDPLESTCRHASLSIL